ncbi:type I-F CRISPR-associated endoribonuclease Cas6/Csy4 [Castellaniella sp.]|uniref:type I-F CRISPR-associated endoribonuclease Cas6/Csy4 n=1 Tax=Castellaniella sp. TaxID=1955812 RepID=UPI002AFEB012|nr:type I-F CRISPR-associated endoribonuclease Cas6/Csy4 [Castellaniella sp.]
MSTHYVDIELLPDPEFSQTHLLSALYSKLHRALATLSAQGVGVSFPNYSMQPRSLGQIMRLHGSLAELNVLLGTDWLRGMRDHVALGAVSVVPSGIEHRRLLRRQFKTNADRLRRRRMQRKGETYQQAAQAIPDSVEQQPRLPYVQMRSSSTGRVFCLFLDLSEPEKQASGGVFNAYGLSQEATVPWF